MKFTIALLFLFGSFYLQAQHTDKSDARIVCRESKELIIKEFGGAGKQERLNKSCFPSNFKEINSYWIVFKSSKDQLLEFKLTPLRAKDDIDFMVMNQSDKPLRCVSSGINVGESYNNYACNFTTGLMSSENKNIEFKGCNLEDTNFAAELPLQKDEIYYLYIHNSSSSAGVRLQFLNNLEFSDIIELELEKINFIHSSQDFTNTDFHSMTKSLDWKLKYAEPAHSDNLEAFTTELSLLNNDVLIKTHDLGNGCFVETSQKYIPPYKKVIATTIGKVSVQTLYPNPTSTNLNIVLETEEINTEVQLKLISMKGEVLYKKNISIKKGVQEYLINVENHPAQNMLLSISNNGQSENFQITKI